MLNFKQISIFFMIMMPLQISLQASDHDICVRPHTILFMSLNISRKARLSEQENNILKQEITSYYKLLDANEGLRMIPRDDNQFGRFARHMDFFSYIMDQKEQPCSDKEKSYKNFNEYIADYKIRPQNILYHINFLFRVKKTPLVEQERLKQIFLEHMPETTLLEQALQKNDADVYINLTRHEANCNKPVLGCKNLLDYAQKNKQIFFATFLTHLMSKHQTHEKND